MSLYMIRTIMTGQTCSKWKIVNQVCQDIISQIPDIGDIKEFSSRGTFQRIIRDLRKDFIAEEKAKYISLLSNASKRSRARAESLGITLSVGEPDYQPIMLLERALRSSAAVCRLTRSFEIENLQELIQSLRPIAFPEICKELERFLSLENQFLLKPDFTNFNEAFNISEIQDKVLQHRGQVISIPYATGFLVGKNYLLTNHHVLSEAQKSSIESFKAQFRYERDLHDRRTKPVEYKLDATFCISDPDLDFALVSLKDFTADTELSKEQKDTLTPSQQDNELIKLKDQKLRDANLSFEKAGDNFGWFWMNPDHTVTPAISRQWIRRHLNQLEQAEIEAKFLSSLRLQGCPGEPVCIIQHPRGRQKEIVLFNNRVTEVLGHSILYEADADFGSSGSPILNTDFQLVGIHSSAIIQYSKNEELTVKANVGTQVQSIVEALKNRHAIENDLNTKEKLNTFLTCYVDVPVKMRQNKIFLLAGRQRGIQDEVELTRAIVKEIIELSQGQQFRVIDVLSSIPAEFRQQKHEEFAARPQNIIELKTAIDWINTSSDNEERYQPGDVALELLTDKYAKSPQSQEEMDSLPRGFTAYYIGNNQERRSHADLLLDGLVTDIPGSVSRGSRSDMVTQPGRLAFCRDIYMPSLVLYLGFLENSKDREILGFQPNTNSFDDRQLKVVSAFLYKNLISWSKILSPISF